MPRIHKQFTAILTKGKNKGAWTFVIMPDSAEYFGTRRLVRIRGLIDGHEFSGTFMAMGGGVHMLPIPADMRRLIQKDAGDQVEVLLTERL